MEEAIVRANSAGDAPPIPTWRKFLPLLATVIVMSIGIAAGIWQTGRAHGKEEIEAKLQNRSQAPALTVAPSAQQELDAAEFRALRVKGEFVADWPLYLENRPRDGKVGFYVMMPFKLSAPSASAPHKPTYLLVARGWVARDTKDRSKLPNLVTPQGEIEITGMIRRQAGRLMQLGSRPMIKPAAILQNLEVAELAQASQFELLPYILEQGQAADIADGLLRDWPRPSSGADKHRGYAFQWFGLATAAFLFYVFTGFRRARRRKQ